MKQMLRRRRYGNTLNYYNNHNIRLLQKYSSTLEKEEYTRVDPVEHVLLRPGMYVGATQRSSRVMWLVNQNNSEMENVNKDDEIIDATSAISIGQEKISFTPALYKIFDEILANAADNVQRDSKMTKIHVDIDENTGEISIFNDGASIPVRMHEKEKMYIPELVLGNLMTGSNFDDNVGRLTGGRHGFGAKLTNIFSKRFEIECADPKEGLLYNQVWENNMQQKSVPHIEPYDSKNGYVRITFQPDFHRFNMDTLSDDDTSRVMERRVIDVAGVNPQLDVQLNGKKVPISDTFGSYASLYQSKINKEPIICKPNNRWEVCVMPSPDGIFEQFSFVNSLTTFRGGTHVNVIADQIARNLAQQINSKHGKILDHPVTPMQVKSHMWLFVKCLIENPSFDSQTKEFLETPPNAFGSVCSLSPSFLKDVYQNSGIVERVVDWARAKQQVEFISKMKSQPKSKLLNIPKLEDANDAGSAKSLECSLILTEGDSAKALAVAGLSVVGRDKYGVFPLKGKMLNVRDAPAKQIVNNEEIKNIISILNLDMRKKYKGDDLAGQGLRYGRIIIMADQDHDGSHIKGLLLNMIACFWPELIKKKDFLCTFNTPIVKAFKKGRTKNKKGTKTFFTLANYNKWKTSLTDEELRTFNVKYYKGLGTSTADEARSYFSHLDKHLVPFSHVGDGDRDFERLDMAFRGHRAADRREWLLGHLENEKTKEDGDGRLRLQSKVPISKFVDDELVLFSCADNIRSIGNAIDGLKPSQRKVLYACFKRKLKSEIKVAQLAGYVSEHSAYHHGEMSLQSTIMGMAQDYVGSNNIPLLFPSGQFGTRLQGGKDSASARYIFTRLQAVTRMIYPVADDPLLTYNDDDGYLVEPEMYVPIIPMALVNGIEGIGTGWSTSVPMYNPLHLIQWLIADMEGKSKNKLIPWVRGFTGDIRPKRAVKGSTSVATFESAGKVHVKNTTTVEITELPVNRWTEDQKLLLTKLLASKTITNFREHHTEEKVSFRITLKRNQLKVLNDEEKLLRLFKLISPIHTSNMHLFDATGTIKKFHTPEDVIEEYYPVRLNLYEDRKNYELSKLSVKKKMLDNRSRFIEMVSDGNIEIQNRNRDEIAASLSSNGFLTKSAINDSNMEMEMIDGENIEENSHLDSAEWKEYDYLLNIPLWQLSAESVETLRKENIEINEKIHLVENTSAEAMWKNELGTLSNYLSTKNKGYQ